ncbi:helix-turn-helix domain-containing protein [Spirillospora sp. NPDC047279]|uniref:helix-turn-helix domain-containing protein n=1 Tax=Spirillospora sp. NPDC047279 TaxID=3155478 RepID=UPI00340C6D3D
MDYVGQVPRPPLDAFIDDIYVLTGVPPYRRMKVPPMPSANLMVNLGEPFQMHDALPGVPSAACGESWAMGLWTRHYVVEWPPFLRLAGVHFKPGGVYPFLRTPLSELHDQIISMDTIWGRFAGEFRERLHAAPTPRAALAVLEGLLRARLMDDPPPGLGIVQHTIGRIAREHGTVPIRELSEQAGVSVNHLGTTFKQLVGVPPKRLARIYRFARVVGSLDAAGPVDWSFLAHQARYYDQSHFTKDFVEFTGLTPGDYLRLRRRFLAENPRHALDVGPLPAE